MKRIEFHGKLERILIQYAPNMPPDFYVATADAIFRMIEEIGMLPPKITEDNDLGISKNQWEPEND